MDIPAIPRLALDYSYLFEEVELNVFDKKKIKDRITKEVVSLVTDKMYDAWSDGPED